MQALCIVMAGLGDSQDRNSLLADTLSKVQDLGIQNPRPQTLNPKSWNLEFRSLNLEPSTGRIRSARVRLPRLWEESTGQPER
jgi:hypothetical protein